ncbi:uncharacterized protein RHO17_016741 isoform 2-T5 [Thomomys bottae]
MACLRHGQLSCIRAAFGTSCFRRRQRNARHRLQVCHKKSHLDLAVAEGVWRELLDSRDGHSDVPGHSYYGIHRPLRQNNCASSPPIPKSLRPEEGQREDTSSGTQDLPVDAASCTPQPPASLEASDVDMQPVGEARLPTAARSPQGSARPACRPCARPEDWTTAWPALVSMQPSEVGRRLLGRARGTRSPPRLGSERDKAPRLVLSKRKLELLLAEPVKTKRKK